MKRSQGRLRGLNVAEPICLLHGHDGPTYDVKFYGDGEDSLLLSCGDDGRIRGWKWMDVMEAKQDGLSKGGDLKPHLDMENPQHKGPWGALSHIPETNVMAVDTEVWGSVFAASGDSYAYCWDVETSKIKLTFKGHAGYLHSVVARNSCNQIITGSEDGTARIWGKYSIYLDSYCRSGKCTNVSEPGKDKKSKDMSSYVSYIALDASEKWLVRNLAANQLSKINLSAFEKVSGTSARACIQDLCFDDNQILAVGAEPLLSRYDINGDMLSHMQCIPRSTFFVSLHQSGVIFVAGYGGVVDVISQFGLQLTTKKKLGT
ncbi:THO complex subunit 6 [Tanacetum coccineum]